MTAPHEHVTPGSEPFRCPIGCMGRYTPPQSHERLPVIPASRRGWIKNRHCPRCQWVHAVFVYLAADRTDWAWHAGWFPTWRAVDEFINMRPEGPTNEDARRAWGA